MKFVPNAVSVKVGRALLHTQKNSPALMFGAGIVGIVGTVVLASRATLKLEGRLESAQSDLADVNSLKHSGYSDKDRNQDKAIIYSKLVMDVAKGYGPAFILGTVSIASLTGSHVVLTRRNAGAVAAYKAVDKAFSEYRERVLKDVGPEKEREYAFEMEACEIDSDDGKSKRKTDDVVRVSGRSKYSRFFEQSNQNWSPQPEYNMLFLRCQQNYANDRFHAKGHLMLNDVYDLLGMERTKEGCVVGWVLDNGDNYVDFGIFDGHNMDKFYDFVTGKEGGIWLDFNVDGLVYDLIGKVHK